MQAFFHFLATNPYILLFLTVGVSVWLGRQTVAGYGLGMVASAIIIGCALSVWGSVYGEKLELNNFTRLLFYYLFMYWVGLRVGPSFVNSLGGHGIKFTFLAFVSCIIGLTLVVVGAKVFDLPMGAAGGMLAGSQTMSAAIGSAEQAVLAGAVTPPAGTTPEQVNAMIALSYGITYIWGTVGIILICKYLPKWWGIDAKKGARDYEREHGVASGDVPALSGWTAGGLRAYRLENDALVGKILYGLLQAHPEYRVVNLARWVTRPESSCDVAWSSAGAEGGTHDPLYEDVCSSL